MEGEEGEGLKLSKRFSDKAIGGEVDYKTKAGTAWSHSYLNQKPWHPLSYPNQRRKWIAEQVDAERQRRADEVAREYAQEQDFFRQASLISKKEKEKVEIMKAVSFMYVRPPGFNPESAKAAEIEDERKRQEQSNPTEDPLISGASSSMPPEQRHHPAEEKKKPRPKDVFGRPLPTEEEFGILKNAPRLETGAPARVKPFGIEIRNVKCLRCGNFGHQSGDRECPLKDAIMPNEESRLRRDDPLTAILAHTDPTEPLKWELKQKPGMSPPRGGFNPDDPNQQIVAEDIFDEYGGFLGANNIPDLLTNFPASKPKKQKSSKRQRHRKQSSPESREDFEEDGSSSPSDHGERKSKKEKNKHKKKRNHSESSSSDDSEANKKHRKRSRRKHPYSSEDSDVDRHHRSKRGKKQQSHLRDSENKEVDKGHRHGRSRRAGDHSYSYSSGDFDSVSRQRSRHHHHYRHHYLH
ncbi:uncharacterized zinc finger CCHC domain-containing protein At4g19190 isoform X1 [Rhodamnia argentea]|uniref:Uncharacterized zinc finger CCHC domain-containing protein At4g19190 isoform X1 n=1 Tax=Rhodamnia argentea TaxID=178133 RepID=A0A8B8QLP4_9MYRT|nr:uncharacterized zinc finger CCHC domain-containing protein At4g19190 isoform X1 [Rhodamnia argentea]